jgi:cytochrome c
MASAPLKAGFHFDFVCPGAYLAELVLPGIERRTGVKLYVPVLNEIFFGKDSRMKTLTLSALVVVTSLATATGALAQDAAAGKTSFNKCLACHAVGEGAKNKAGPALNGLDGRKSSTIEGYSYSDANKNAGITWNKDVFLEYIKEPKAKIRGTKMVFAGIKNEKEAGDLWAYLASFGKDGKTK